MVRLVVLQGIEGRLPRLIECDNLPVDDGFVGKWREGPGHGWIALREVVLVPRSEPHTATRFRRNGPVVVKLEIAEPLPALGKHFGAKEQHRRNETGSVVSVGHNRLHHTQEAGCGIAPHDLASGEERDRSARNHRNDSCGLVSLPGDKGTPMIRAPLGWLFFCRVPDILRVNGHS